MQRSMVGRPRYILGPRPPRRLTLAVVASSLLLTLLVIGTGHQPPPPRYNDVSPAPEEPRRDPHAERRERLRDGCRRSQRVRAHITLPGLIRHRQRLLRHVIVDDRHRLLYCYVPKASSTQWKKVFARLAGTLPDKDKDNGAAAHENHRHTLLSAMTPEQIRQRLQNYRAFLFVRHPLERLVSAYTSKLEVTAPQHLFPRHLNGQILHPHRSNKTGAGAGDAENSTERVTFRQFASWLADPAAMQRADEWSKPLQGRHNEHWEPMTSLCHPCVIDYHTIGHQETLLADAERVLREANITEVHFPQESYQIYQDNTRAHGTHSKAPTVLATLPPDQIRFLLRHYYLDFKLFGFEPSSIFDSSNKPVYKLFQTIFANITMDEAYTLSAQLLT